MKFVITPSSGVAATLQTLAVSSVILGANLGTGIITARFLGPNGRGMQAAMIMWPQVLAYILAMGLPSALLYNLKFRPEKSDSLVGAALLIGGVLGLTSVLAGVLVIPLWLQQYTVEVVRFAQFAMLTAPLILLGLVCNSAMRARDAFTMYNWTRFLPHFLPLCGLVLLLLTQRLTPFTSAYAYLSGVLLASCWAVVWAWRRYRPTLRAFAATRGHLISYSLRSWGTSFLNTLSAQFDRILVVGFFEPAQLGLYVVALSLSRTLRIFQDAVVSVLFPKASGRPKEEVLALTGRTVRVSVAVTALAATGLFLLGPLVLKILYSADFTAATTVFRLLVVEAVISCATAVLAQTFMALDRPGVVTVSHGVGVGLSVPLLVWLVARYNLEGAGIALLVSALVRLIVLCTCFPVVLKVPPPRLWMMPDEIAAALGGLSRWLRKEAT